MDASSEKVISLAQETQFAPNGIVSRTLLRTPIMRVGLVRLRRRPGVDRTHLHPTRLGSGLIWRVRVFPGGQTAQPEGRRFPPHAAEACRTPSKRRSSSPCCSRCSSRPKARSVLPSHPLPITDHQALNESVRTVTLDVREDIRNGREPFAKIMQTVAGLKDNEQLLLIAPFEPAPLFAVLAQRGYSHESKPTPEGDFEVLFTRGLSRLRQAEDYRSRLPAAAGFKAPCMRRHPRHRSGCPRAGAAAAAREDPGGVGDVARRRPAARAHRPPSHAPVRPTGRARLRGREQKSKRMEASSPMSAAAKTHDSRAP